MKVAGNSSRNRWVLICRGDAAETAGALPNLHPGGACGEPPCGGQGGAIGATVHAVAGDDVVIRVELIEGILGHRPSPLFGSEHRSAWRGGRVAPVSPDAIGGKVVANVCAIRA